MNTERSLFARLTNNGVSRRSFLKQASYAGLATVSIGSLFSACGQAAQSDDKIAPRGTKPTGTITLVYMGTADQQKAWNALFGLFKKHYPDITLNARAIPSTNWAAFFDTVSTQIAGGQVPDIVQVATEGQRLFASRGLVQPIDAYLERDKEDLADFFNDIHPNLVKWNKQSSPDGKTYYLPGEFNTMCVWYHTELFKQANVDEPTDSWKWTDFHEAASRLTRPGQVYGMNVTPDYFAGLMPWLLTNGASTMDDAWKKATVDSAQAIEATKFMRSMIEQKISPLPGGTFDAATLMSQGKLAMIGGGRWPVISMRKLNIVDKLKLVAWPQHTKKGSPIGWNAYPIMRSSQNKEAAWAFVKFITSKEASTYFATQGGTIVPPRKSVATSDAFLSNAPAGSEKLYEALEYATPIPSPNKGNVIQKDIEDAFKQILVGNIAAEQGLQQLNQKIQANL